MIGLLNRFVRLLIDKGASRAVMSFFIWLVFKIDENLATQYALNKRRLFLSDKLSQKFGGFIKYGPLKGVRLSSCSWWGSADRASMLFGLYEKEILDSISLTPNRYKVFIDLGAADGYYGVGLVASGIFEKSYCYEISSGGQIAIAENARLNGVSDRVEVRGGAGKGFYNGIDVDEIERSVLFVDIEGGEFDLFDEEMLRVFSKSIIYVEIHEWFFDDGFAKLSKLEALVRDYFSIKKITTASRDLSNYDELAEMCDNDRWLICSEGRGRLMNWWRLDPL